MGNWFLFTPISAVVSLLITSRPHFAGVFLGILAAFMATRRQVTGTKTRTFPPTR